MYNRKNPAANGWDHWKYWAILVSGILMSLAAGIAQGANNIIDPSRSIEFQTGTVVGTGLAAGIIIWLLIHFGAIRAASKPDKWLAFFAINLASVAGALVGWSSQ